MQRHKRGLIHSLVAGGLLVLAVSATGCVAHAGASTSATIYAEPDLVEIQPGIYVVENHGHSVFFSDGYYWRYSSGIWYRSGYYDSGFVRVAYYGVPVRVRGISRPGRYVRWRSRARARRMRARARHQRRAHRRAARDHRRVQRRDNRRAHRAERNAWRNDRRAARRDARHDRRAAKRDRRAARRDARHDRRKDEKSAWKKGKKKKKKKKKKDKKRRRR